MAKHNDPWAEPDGFSQVDWSLRPEDSIDPDEPQLPETGTVLNPEIIRTPVPDPVALPEPVADEPDSGPEVIDIEDGTLTLEHDKGWWVATLQNAVGGSPQVYKGKNKNDLLVATMKAQLNATKKIRELNRKLKTAPPAPVRQPVAPAPISAPRELTADEIVDLKLQLEENPALAFSKMFQQATGMSLSELQELKKDAKLGKQARLDTIADEAGRAFCASHPDYYGCESNFIKLVDYLAQTSLGKHADKNNALGVMYELIEGDFYSPELLEDAYRELKEDGLLTSAPRPVAQPVAQPLPEPPAAPQPNRIVRTETRPRAAFGIQKTDVSNTPAPATQNAPTVEDFNSMTDAEVAAALAATRRHIIQSRRS